MTSSRRPRSTSEKIFSFPSTRCHETGPAQVYSGLLAPVAALHGLGSHHTALPLDASSFSPLIANRAGRLVLETLDPLPGDRKCFRLINGVLVERTVKDVVPALRTNAEGLKKVLDDLVKQYKAKQDELEKWKVWNRRPACVIIPPGLTPSAEEEQCPGCAVMKRSVPGRCSGSPPQMPCHQAPRVWSASADRAEETANIQDTSCTDVFMAPPILHRGRGQSKSRPKRSSTGRGPVQQRQSKVHFAPEADGT